MAALHKKNETVQFINEWQREGSRGERFIKWAATEQRANLTVVKERGHGGWCNVDEYETCVQMLEAAANRY